MSRPKKKSVKRKPLDEQDIVAVYLPRYLMRQSLRDAKRVIERGTYQCGKIDVDKWKGFARELAKSVRSKSVTQVTR